MNDFSWQQFHFIKFLDIFSEFLPLFKKFLSFFFKISFSSFWIIPVKSLGIFHKITFPEKWATLDIRYTISIRNMLKKYVSLE